MGLAGVARTGLSPQGTIEVHGELWTAVSDTPLQKNDRVEVVGIDGLVLRVRKV